MATENPSPTHMTPAQFRDYGHQLVDWIAQYWENIEQYPVQSQVEPGQIRASLPSSPPEQGEPFSHILADLDRLIIPGVTHWQSPGFFGFYPSNSSFPSILGDLASSGLGVQGMLWSTSPACTEVETLMLDWLAQLCGLPDRFLSTRAGGGVIQDSASSASLVAILAARERITNFEANRTGNLGNLTAYCSDQAHTSIEKGIKIAGLGSEQLRAIPTDGEFRLRTDLLAEAIKNDLAAGRQPTIVVGTVGTTSTGGIDPIPEIAELCQSHNIWLHVDAAYAGNATVLPELRWLTDGLESADSYCFNPHKWMLGGFDLCAFYVADRTQLIRTLGILPEYLRNPQTESGAVIDYRDWQIPLGRRFRALKLWMVLRHYGAEGIRDYIRYQIGLAQRFAQAVLDHPDFEICAPHPLGLVCFRHRKGEARNREILSRVNASGEVFLTHTVVGGEYMLRLALGSSQVSDRHVDRAWELISQEE